MTKEFREWLFPTENDIRELVNGQIKIMSIFVDEVTKDIKLECINEALNTFDNSYDIIMKSAKENNLDNEDIDKINEYLEYTKAIVNIIKEEILAA